jgi:hypothetical protein
LLIRSIPSSPGQPLSSMNICQISNGHAMAASDIFALLVRFLCRCNWWEFAVLFATVYILHQLTRLNLSTLRFLPHMHFCVDSLHMVFGRLDMKFQWIHYNAYCLLVWQLICLVSNCPTQDRLFSWKSDIHYARWFRIASKTTRTSTTVCMLCLGIIYA